MKDKISKNKKWILSGFACLLLIVAIFIFDTIVSSNHTDMMNEEAEFLDATLFTKKKVATKDINNKEQEENTKDLENEEEIPETTATEESSNVSITSNEELPSDTLEEETLSNEATTQDTSKVVASKYSDIIYGKIGDLSSEDVPIAISTAKSFVNIRELPNTESKVLGKLYSNAAAAVVSIENDWVLIESGTVKGYITSEYLNMELAKDEVIEQYGTLQASIGVNGLNVREEASEEAKRLTVIYENEKYPVLEVLDEWVKISIDDDDIVGFVSKEYVTLSVKFTQAISIEEEQAIIRQQKEEEERKAAEKARKAAEKAAKEKSEKKSSSSSSSKKEEKKETSVKVESRSAFNYAEEDLKLLACLVHSESGNQPYEGKLAVANVVLNRVKSSRYPNNIRDVIYQSGQFSVAKSGSLQKQLDKYSSYSSQSQNLSIQAAKAALGGENNIGNMLYFNGYSSSLASKHSNGVRIADHLFW